MNELVKDFSSQTDIIVPKIVVSGVAVVQIDIENFGADKFISETEVMNYENISSL